MKDTENERQTECTEHAPVVAFISNAYLLDRSFATIYSATFSFSKSEKVDELQNVPGDDIS